MPNHVVTITSYGTSTSHQAVVRTARALQRLDEKLSKRDDVASVHVRIDWSEPRLGTETAQTAHSLGWSHA